MVETKQKPEQSLIGRVRQMAGAADTADPPEQGQAPVVLPDGYRRRSPVQHCARRARRISPLAAALLGLLATALLVIAVTVVLRILF